MRGKSAAARMIAGVMRIYRALGPEPVERTIRRRERAGERRAKAPRGLRARTEDTAHGRVFYANEGSEAGVTVFYLHGGAYLQEITPIHWHFLKQVIRHTGAAIIVPKYRLIPFGDCADAFELIVPLYEAHIKAHPARGIVLMGDSAGGGLAIAIAEELSRRGMRAPDRVIAVSPWTDVTMESAETKALETIEPWLSSQWLSDCGKAWAGSAETRDPRVSPVFGEEQMSHVTIFAGGEELLRGDAERMYARMDPGRGNALIIGERMNHVYPLLPIPEAKAARAKIYELIRSAKGAGQ